MTLCDLVLRLQELMKEKTWNSGITRTSQVKIGKSMDNSDDCFDFFDIVKKDDCIVLMPSSKWERK